MTDTRDAFEAEAKHQEMDLNRFEQGYSDCNTDYGWLFWQAATVAERTRCLQKCESESGILNNTSAWIALTNAADAIRSGK